MARSLSSLLALSALGGVLGHGGVYNYTTGGVQYGGQYPYLYEDEQPESIQRRWFPDPIQDVHHPYLSCNRGYPLATRNPSLHAPVEAGTNVTVTYIAPPCPPGYHQPEEPSVPWKNEPARPFRCLGPEYPWVHSLGPMFVYMADCGGSCADFDPADNKVWFKVFEAGYSPEGVSWDGKPEKWDVGMHSAWAQAKLPRQEGGWSVQIPKNLKPGNYLIRHEIIMIELEPAQHYPECAQLEVTGEGDQVPSEEYLVSFPGAYSYEDPGISLAGNVYNQIGHSTFNYTMPGPKVWTGEQ